MMEIPVVVELLYHYWVAPAAPNMWPEHLQNNPVLGHGLYSFYRGLCLGIQLMIACKES